MNDFAPEMHDAAALKAEIARLRAHVERLEEQVEALDQLAHQDPLIALPNRRAFMRELERLVARVTRHGEGAALLFVDFDGLKTINDSFGHHCGDQALIKVAELLCEEVRRSDAVGRIGGDEFGVLLQNTTQEGAQETAERLRDIICSFGFSHGGASVPLGVSIGVAMIAPGDSATDVMTRADEEMYRRKDAA